MLNLAATSLMLSSFLSAVQPLPVADTGQDSRAYVSVSIRFLFAFDDSGHVLWKVPLEGNMSVATYAWDGSCLAVNTGEDVVALDLRTGREQWRAHVGSKLRRVAVSGDTVYVSTGDEVLFYEARTGRVTGRMQLGRNDRGNRLVRFLRRLIPARPVRTRILVNQTRNYVVAFDHEANLLWKIPASGYRLLGTSTCCGFLVSADTVKVFDLRTGTEIWRKGHPAGIRHVVIGSRTEVFLRNGDVFLYDSKTGKLLKKKRG